MKHLLASAAFAGLALSAGLALAQGAATVKVSESEEYGKYLTDADGRALYLFTADTQGAGGATAEVSCTGECLTNWPPFYSDGDPQAGDGADSAKIGTVEHDGKQMVTYNGWPLYHFAKDEEPGQTNGQEIESYGGEWYLVTPEGEEVEEDE
jgi:predicted lipoprotein with Yx(FWY)xxD motif